MGSTVEAFRTVANARLIFAPSVASCCLSLVNEFISSLALAISSASDFALECNFLISSSSCLTSSRSFSIAFLSLRIKRIGKNVPNNAINPMYTAASWSHQSISLKFFSRSLASSSLTRFSTSFNSGEDTCDRGVVLILVTLDWCNSVCGWFVFVSASASPTKQMKIDSRLKIIKKWTFEEKLLPFLCSSIFWQFSFIIMNNV